MKISKHARMNVRNYARRNVSLSMTEKFEFFLRDKIVFSVNNTIWHQIAPKIQDQLRDNFK